jgi:hypothetical protein
MLDRVAWNFTTVHKRFINVKVRNTYITKRDTIDDIIITELNTLPRTYTNTTVNVSHNQTHTTSHTDTILN